ncbi:fungal-specific transcription factor domain-containing protein [Achaetomium macrosporum]|uniref:Fungal-specific transcription factor domain-containing protein n=1 Tax=Achaetomium macrosporum TaxID=79813 RepID=A0AAN7CDM5_9PEZI|nr:fungal-specific transcription factor domain-containing protein [Achaetomium macrosporum]
MPGEGSTAAQASGTEDSPKPPDAASMTSGHDGYDAAQILALARHPPPGASVYSPTAAPSSALNPRSCVTCRRRKVRCDKHMPCSNCRRAQIPCIFPAPGRAPRRPRPKDPNAPAKQPSSERELELMKRLRKLEGIVEELSGQIEIESVRHPYSAGNSPETPATNLRDEHNVGARVGFASHAVGVGSGTPSQDSPSVGAGMGAARLPARPTSESMSEPDLRATASPDVHKQFGRLVLNEKGVTRYVSSSLWTSINDEVGRPLHPGGHPGLRMLTQAYELRKASQNLTDEGSDESDLDATPESSEHDKSLLDHHSFVFGYRSADVDLRPLHPLPSQIPFIWQVYQENVDPILKVIHVPSMSKIIKEIRHNFDSLTPSMEALMFSVYYASITSLDEEEVTLNFGTEKSLLLQKYRFALEQALAKAEFLVKPDFTVVQAFLLFLILVRRHDDTRFAWTLTGLLIRLSQALGLHRDGSHFPNLTPFQVEMRRRLFWAVCVLDLRSAEDQGTDLTIVDRTFDTQIPLNINDADISPDSPRLPEPREGTTDMAFSLIRYEICALSRRMHAVPSGVAPSAYPDACKSLEEREALLTEVYQRVQNRLLKDRDSSNPLYWVASNVTKIIVAKMTLIIYQPVLFPGPGNGGLSEDVRARLLNAAVDIFEYNHLLNTDPRCKQWRWLFQTWSHWHALAYTLIEVSHHPWGPKAERAWAALNLTFQSPNPAELEKLASHHAVWMPLRKLYFKVRKHREAEIARLQADPQAARELDLQEQASTAPRTFGAIPSSVKGAIALDRWRKLVNLPVPPQEAIQPQQQPQPQPQPQHQHLAPQRSQTLQPNTTMALLQPSSITDFAKPEVMEYLDAAMADSTPFIPTDLGPLYPVSEDIRAAFFAYPTGDLARADTSSSLGFDPSTPIPDIQQIGRTPTSVSLPSTLPNHVGQQQQPQQPQQTQTPQPRGIGLQTTGTSMNDDSNLPSWLWPTNGSPDILRMPSTGGEDMDMNMDEGFDWQTWQESLGRYELEANGGRAGSTWGPGL